MTEENPAIIGSKGGGGATTAYVTQNVYANPTAKQPTITKDNLQSKAYARILDLISEGEIGGLVTGDNKSIYLDDTPVQNEDGTYNFLGVNIQSTLGTQDQGPLTGFNTVETEKAVGVTVEADNAIPGTWTRDWNDSAYTRSGSTITISWVGHGLSSGNIIWLNFGTPTTPKWDADYTVTVLDDDQFTVQRKKSSFKTTSGNVYAIKKYLIITASTRDGSDWVNDDKIYIKFLKPSLDITKKSSTIYAATTSYNKVYKIEAVPGGSPSQFRVPWYDKASSLAKAQVDGGYVRIADAKYTYNSSTNVVTVTAKSHGYVVGSIVEINPKTGPLKTLKGIETVTSVPNADTFTYTQKGPYSSTGSGEYFAEVPLNSGAITRQITNPDVDRVRLNISVGALQQQIDDGSVVGTKFTYAVDFQFNGGGFFQAKYEEIKGKTSGGFSFSRELSFATQPGWNSTTISANFPIDIRLRRVNEDSETTVKVNAFSWQAYTEITDAKLAYPNSALIGVEVDAQQFSSIPNRMYHIKGVKIRVPSNATADLDTGALSYSGIWDGTFTANVWCSDPAWVLWDLLTSRRYGFGEEILTDGEKSSFDGNASRLDKWSFYAASQYASELVTTTTTDGKTITEPRFSCNVNLQSKQDAFTLINQLLSVFRTQAFWSNGSVVLAQDRPHDASYIFGPSNVVEGNFSYSGSDVKTRPTVILVRYFNTDTRDVATEVVEDPGLIEKYGVVTEELDAFACNSRSQAARLGRWLLYTNAYETETVSFSIGIESGVVLRPGMIINVSDPTRAGTRLSGRVSSATTTTVVIDVDRTVQTDYTISVMLPDGILETRSVSAYDSGTRTVTVSSAFSVAPAQNSVWLMRPTNVAPTTWRVISLAEDTENGVYGVTALAYNSGKFDYVEADVPLFTPNISVIGAPPAGPTNLAYSENLYVDNNKVFVKVSISWSPVEGAVSYEVRYRVDDGNWVNLTPTATSQVDIANALEGDWQVEVTAVGVTNKKSQPSPLNYEVIGKTADPEDMELLQISQIGNKQAELGWPASVDLDVLVGGKVIIRHSTQTSGVEWQNCNDIIPAVAGNATNAVVPLLAGTYMAKFEDSSGNRSLNPISVTVTLPAPQSPLLVLTYAEESTVPPYDGDSINMFYNDELDALVLDQGLTVDELAVDDDFDQLGSVDQIGGVISEGEYLFAQPIDLQGVFTVDVAAQIVTGAFLPGDLFDDKEELIDSWEDIDGGTLDLVNATLYTRTTNDDPAADDPEFTDWQPFVNGARTGRGFEFKVIATSSEPTQNIAISELGTTVTMATRNEQGNDLTSGASSYAVTFANAFYQTPSIGISAQDLQTGDFYELTSVSKTGFTITFKNSGGTAVSRTFDWQAVGYGKQLA